MLVFPIKYASATIEVEKSTIFKWVGKTDKEGHSLYQLLGGFYLQKAQRKKLNVYL